MQRSKSRLTLALAALALVALIVAACGAPHPRPHPRQSRPPPSRQPWRPPRRRPQPLRLPRPPWRLPPPPRPGSSAIPSATARRWARWTRRMPGSPASPSRPAILNGLRQALNIPAATPNDQFEKSTFWRCMGGKVYACNVGANIPCSAKAVTDKTPTQAMKEFCTANPKSDFLPAAVTGRETVYSWKCTDGVPAIDKELPSRTPPASCPCSGTRSRGSNRGPGPGFQHDDAESARPQRTPRPGALLSLRSRPRPRPSTIPGRPPRNGRQSRHST